MGETNIDLISDLSDEDACLHRYSVFPVGGVGYNDSSLPYDGLKPLDAAFLSFRAEVLRGNPTTVADVVRDLEDGEPTQAVVVLAGNAPGATTVESVASSSEAVEALSALRDAGWEVRTDSSAGPSVLELCQIEQSVRSLVDDKGEVVTTVTAPNARDGVLDITISDSALNYRSVKDLVARYGSWIRLAPEPGEYQLYDRLSDSQPFKGGGRLYHYVGGP